MKEVFSISPSAHGGAAALFRWDPLGKYLAVCGSNRRVQLYDRSGDMFFEFALTGGQGRCMELAWDCEGEILAAMQEGAGDVALWSASAAQLQGDGVTVLKTNLENPTFCKWARAGPYLAVGNQSGNMLVYNKLTFKKVVVQGLHTKAITHGMWSLDNKLALTGQDRMLTVSDAEGRILTQEMLKHDAFDVQFAEQKADGDVGGAAAEREKTVSINVARRTVLLYKLNDETELPIQLQFNAEYGEIVTYKWFGDGYMIVGFSRGMVIQISTHEAEISHELHSSRVFDGDLFAVEHSPNLSKFAAIGQDGLRVVDLSDWSELQEFRRDFSPNEGRPRQLQWTKDGQILTVGTSKGFIFNILMDLPVMYAQHGTMMAVLSSLHSVTLKDAAGNMPQREVSVSTEPAFLALGPGHVATGRNNHVWFYAIRPPSGQLVNERDNYLGPVSKVCLNSRFALVLSDGRAELHPIERSASREAPRVFPDNDHDTITCVAMTESFVMYATERGTVHQYYLGDEAAGNAAGFVSEYRHESSVLSLYPNLAGTRIIIIDDAHRGFVYNPVDDTRVQINKLRVSTETILWDAGCPQLFVAVDIKAQRLLVTYLYRQRSTHGPTVSQVANTKVPVGFNAMLCLNGHVYGRRGRGSGAKVTHVVLSSHDSIAELGASASPGSVSAPGSGVDMIPSSSSSSTSPTSLGGSGVRKPSASRHSIMQLLSLGRLREAWSLARSNRNRDSWLPLARRAMEHLDVELGIRIYRELGDAGMVMSLEKIRHVEDQNLLAGHISLLFGDYTAAQSMFVNSSQPLMALEMQKHLFEWEHALKLASTLAPEEIPDICRQYAQQMEFKGEYEQALRLYEQALAGAGDDAFYSPEGGDGDDGGGRRYGAAHTQACRDGITRMTIRCNQVPAGRKMALQSGNKRLMKECAVILDSMKLYADAAELYVKADCFEKAAGIYIAMKDFRNAEPLMDKITAPKLHAQFAKAKESEGRYAEAAIAYERAKDMDSVVRLNLTSLNNPAKAFDVVRQTRSSEGAAMIARFCQSTGDFRGAIEFLLLANRSEDAFELAETHNEMEQFAEALGDAGTTQEYLNIAIHFERNSQLDRAGHFHAVAGDYTRAMKLFLKCGDACLDDAVDVVRKSIGTQELNLLVSMLRDCLLGETDGVVKDPKYVFKLDLALGNYAQAAKTAIMIAAAEQSAGRYGKAHEVLLKTHQDLLAAKVSIPEQLEKSLRLLHSYVLVKRRVGLGDHETAARMLMRVANSISKFPAHMVAILTSTVIECQRAGLKRTSAEYARMLVRPEYRQEVDPRYKRKIEAIVRRPAQTMTEAEEALSPCPFCEFALPESLLDCPSCRNSIPYCVTTGKHMVLDDWSVCASCGFPSLCSELSRTFQSGEKTCAMCNENIQPTSLVKVPTATAKDMLIARLQQQAGIVEEDGDNGNDDDGDDDSSSLDSRSTATTTSRSKRPPSSKGQAFV